MFGKRSEERNMFVVNRLGVVNGTEISETGVCEDGEDESDGVDGDEGSGVKRRETDTDVELELEEEEEEDEEDEDDDDELRVSVGERLKKKCSQPDILEVDEFLSLGGNGQSGQRIRSIKGFGREEEESRWSE